MNRIILMGRLTTDPDYRQATKNVASFTLAVNRYKADADFIRCVAFGKTADNIDKYFKKGSQILVEGNIHTSTYTNKDGRTFHNVEVWVSAFEFTASPQAYLDKKEEEPGGGFTNVADALDDEGVPFN